MMETKLSPVLDRWRDEGVDELDAMHGHFKELLDRGEFGGWIEVAEEGRQLWNRMFDQIETDSPIHGILLAVAAAAFETGLRGVAARIGVSAFSVECAIESDGNPPDAEKFLQDCRQVDADLPRS